MIATAGQCRFTLAHVRLFVRMALFRCYVAAKASFWPFIKTLSFPCRYIGSALVTAAPSMLAEETSMTTTSASSSITSLQPVAPTQQQQQMVTTFPSCQDVPIACQVPAVVNYKGLVQLVAAPLNQPQTTPSVEDNVIHLDKLSISSMTDILQMCPANSGFCCKADVEGGAVHPCNTHSSCMCCGLGDEAGKHMRACPSCLRSFSAWRRLWRASVLLPLMDG